MFDLVPNAVRNFVDAIFGPPITFLQMVIDFLNRAALIAGKGINLNNYFGFISYLPASLQAVFNSIIASIVFLAILQLIKAIMRMYGQSKSWLKWW